MSISSVNSVGQQTVGVTMTFGLALDPQIPVLVNFTKTGNLCTMEIPDVVGTASGSTTPWLASGTAIPDAFWPVGSDLLYFPVFVVSGSSLMLNQGALTVGATGQLIIQKNADESQYFATTGENGIVRTSVIYRVNP